MAQTQKILDTIYSDDLDDNTVGDTSNENIRNAVESLRPRMGELYLDTPASTTIGAVSTYVKVAGTTTLSTDPTPYEVSMPENNRLRYDGAAKAFASVRGLVSMKLDSGVNQTLTVALTKNGVVLSRSAAPRLHSGTSDTSRMVVETKSEVVADDYFEIWVANETSTANATAQKLQLLIETKAIGS